MERFITLIKSPNVWLSAAIIVAVLTGLSITRRLERQVFKKRMFPGNSATQIKIIHGVVRYLILIAATIVVLQLNGINLSSIITGLGIVGIIVGFALQDILKDVIMGINIITKAFVHIGDVILYEGKYWEVTDMSIRFLYLKQIDSAEMYIVSNRNISQLCIQPAYQDVTVPGSYKVPRETMKTVCGRICDRVCEIPEVRKSEYLGIDCFGESQILYKIRVYAEPIFRDSIRRKVNDIICAVLEENRLEIPFNQLDVHLEK